jgi:hypothetical protein
MVLITFISKLSHQDFDYFHQFDLPSLGKDLPATRSNLKEIPWPGMVAHTCNPRNSGGIGKRITVKAGFAKRARPYLKNN